MQKIIFKNKIISQAINLGFDFETIDRDSTIEEINDLLLEFFYKNYQKLPQIEDECEVESSSRSQYVIYGDYQCSGEIVNFSDHWHKPPETKIHHSSFVTEDKEDGLMKNVNLYYLVGETDYNAPDGYWYNPKTKSHEKIHLSKSK